MTDPADNMFSVAEDLEQMAKEAGRDRSLCIALNYLAWKLREAWQRVLIERHEDKAQEDLDDPDERLYLDPSARNPSE